MPGQTEHRRLAAIMFTDMVGYSALAQRNEALALALLEEHRRIVRDILPRHGGREVKTTGDGFLIEFPSALAAVEAAVAVQQALRNRNDLQAAERQVQVRIGIHVGDVVLRDGDIHGDGVNIAARIEPLAEPGGICISRAVFDQIQNKVPQQCVPLNKPELKNISASVEVYRLILDAASEAAIANAPAAAPGRRLLYWIVVGVVALNACLFVTFGLKQGNHPASGTVTNGPTTPRAAATNTNASANTSASQKSIAVLPFVNMSADKSDEYLGDGMTEELLNALAKVPGLRVPGRTSCFAFKGKAAENIFRMVGEQLHVNTVLEGSVRRAGDKLRITAQLINVSDGFHLWSENYDGDMKDILNFQSDVAHRVVQALQVQLAVEAAQMLGKTSTEDPEAHRLYLLGRYYLYKGTEENSRKAIEYFNQALARDPNYARAYCGLADSLGDWKQAPKEYLPKLRAYAQAALRLDPLLPEAHVSMGSIRVDADWDFAGAEQEMRQAIQLNPNLDAGHDGYGYCLMLTGRFQEAIAEMKKAVALDPLSPPTLIDLGWTYCYARDFDRAIETAKQAQDLEPEFPWSYSLLSSALVLKGKGSEAIPHAEKLLSLSDNNWSLMEVIKAQAAAGNTNKARALLQELDDRAARNYVSLYTLATARMSLHDSDRALELLERAVAEHNPSCTWMKIDLNWDGLRSDPRFQALLKKVGFPE